MNAVLQSLPTALFVTLLVPICAKNISSRRRRRSLRSESSCSVSTAAATSKSPIQQQSIQSTPASKTQQETLEDTKDKNRTEDMKAKNKVPIQKEVVKDKDKVASQKEGIKEKEKKKYKSESAPSENTDHDAPPLQRRSNDESDKVYTKKQLEILLGVHQETTPLIQPKEANTQNCGVDAVEISQPGSINMNSSISTRRSKKRARLPDIKTDITEASACRKSVQDSLITNGSLNQELKPVTHLLDVKKEEEVQPTQAPDLSENDSIRTAVG